MGLIDKVIAGREAAAAIMFVAVMAVAATGQPTVSRDHTLPGKSKFHHPQPEVVAIAAPSVENVVSNTYEFKVDTSGAPTTASVAYYLGSFLLGVVSTKPYALAWNSGFAADGSYTLVVYARNASGITVARSSTIITISNHQGTIGVTAPDLGKPVNGSINLAIVASDQAYYPAQFNVFLDGQFVRTVYVQTPGQNRVSISTIVDTTKVENGSHELHIEVESNYFPSGLTGSAVWYDHRLAFSRVVEVNNGHTLMGIASNFQHVYLRPNTSTGLLCNQVFTDGADGPCLSVIYESNNAASVTVAPSGEVTAGSTEGFAVITVADAGLATQVYVWVRKSVNVPHFSGDGRMLLSYQRGASMFVVAPFLLEPTDLQADDIINKETRRAGVNTLFSEFYINLRDTTRPYTDWEGYYDTVYGASWRWAADNGYHLYTMGDEVVRTVGTGWWTLNWPPAEQAVQHAMASLAGSGVAIAVDIIDEGNILWGPTPTPPRLIGDTGMLSAVSCNGDSCTVTWPNHPLNTSRRWAGAKFSSFAFAGSINSQLNTPRGEVFVATNISKDAFDFVPAGAINGTFTAMSDPNMEFLWWAGSAPGCPSAPCAPPVPNTVLSTAAEWMRSASPRVPISWPSQGAAPVSVHDAWGGKDSQISDFMSHYWQSLQAGTTYSWSSGVAERTSWERSVFYQRQPYVRLDRPQVMLIAITSYSYSKQTPGGAYYSPPADILIEPGTSAPAAAAEIMTAVELGNAGVRMFQFEEPSYLKAREAASMGTQLATGASPIAGDDNSRHIWRSIAYTSNVLTKTVQPFILGSALSSPSLGTNIVTAARESQDGKLLMVTNGNDWSRTISVDLTSYTVGHKIDRYIVGGYGIETDILWNRMSDTLVLEPGATAIYIFSKERAVSQLSPVSVLAPTLVGESKRAILHHGYIYADDLDLQATGMDCTNGCNMTVDPRIGDVVGQFWFLDGRGRVLSKSAIETIFVGHN